MARRLAFALALGWLFLPSAAGAQPGDDVGRANAFFNAGKVLRDAGQLAEACPLFAASKRIAPAVGVTLYLADCYERTGRIASAWAEFRSAEKLATEHDDKRAETARERARLLEPKLAGLTLVVPSYAGQEAPELLLDGTRVPPDEWNRAMAVDPGDHVVTIHAPGHPPRTVTAHVDSGSRDATVRVEDAEAASASAVAGAPSEASPAPAATVEPSPTVAPVAPGSHSGRRWAAIGLVAAGTVGLGIGTTFLLNKDQPGPASCNPPPNDNGPTTGAAIAFSAGGLALASGVVLLLTAPHESTAAWTVAPLPLVGGGGASLRAQF